MLDLPWHVWLLVHHVTGTSFDLSKLLSPAYLSAHWHRVGTADHELLAQIRAEGSWSYLPLLIMLGLAGALILGRFRTAAFASAWLALSFGGLLLVYWTSPFPLGANLFNSADRTIDTLVIGGALLVPALLALGPPAGSGEHAPGPDEPVGNP